MLVSFCQSLASQARSHPKIGNGKSEVFAVFCYAAICPASTERDRSRANWIPERSVNLRDESATFCVDLHLYEAFSHA
jgi:hypothetical protein